MGAWGSQIPQKYHLSSQTQSKREVNVKKAKPLLHIHFMSTFMSTFMRQYWLTHNTWSVHSCDSMVNLKCIEVHPWILIGAVFCCLVVLVTVVGCWLLIVVCCHPQMMLR